MFKLFNDRKTSKPLDFIFPHLIRVVGARDNYKDPCKRVPEGWIWNPLGLRTLYTKDSEIMTLFVVFNYSRWL